MIAYFEKQMDVLEECIHSLNETEFRKWVDAAVGTLQSGHKIIVSGLGKNVPICEKFVGSMVSMGLDACFLHTNSAVHGDMGAVKDGDMVIILTKSGETSESVYLVRRLKERSIDLWLLSFEEKSTLAREIQNRIILSLRDEGDQWNIMPNNSTTMNLIVLQGLAMMVARKLEVPLWQFKRNHPGGAIGEQLCGRNLNMEGPLAGVIVPVFNGEKTLERCIESIRNQTYGNLQIILVDDGSVDHSGEICQNHASRDKRITVITRPNGGLVRARKEGIRKCTAEFVSWVDADDWIEEDYIEKLIKMQQQSRADIVAPAHYKDFGENSICVKNGIADGVYERNELVPRLLYTGEFFEYGVQPHLCTKLFKTDILKRTQEMVPDMVIVGEDAAVTYPSILMAEKICITSISGYHYIQHAQSMTKTVFSNEEERIKTLTGFLRNEFEKAGVAGQTENQLRAYENYVLAIKHIEIFDRDDDSKILSPFGGFRSTDRIALYGAGVLGQRIYHYLVSKNIRLVCWLDKNYEVYRGSGIEVDSPDILPDVKDSFDYIVIANVTEKLALDIFRFLKEKGVPEEKIRWFSEKIRQV